ncbi:MAG: methyl-accepting chemotaxis protein [Treponema sp.]|jgi:methyl-accepting chemotaxis protein|nr:methyl-accepting chemotaxis protein [Treponema sp.]
MKLNFKLSLIVIIIVVVILVTVAVILLQRSAGLTIGLNKDAISYLGSWRATYWENREDQRLQTLRVMASQMEDYEALPAETRRDEFERMMMSVLKSNDQIITIYTIWKPNAIDGMDSRYIGRPGSSPTGQYAAAVTRETGSITMRASADIPGTMEYINGPNARKERAMDPEARTVQGKEIYVIRFMVPIINRRTNEVVGGIGAWLDIAPIQGRVVQTVQTNDIIARLAVIDDSGFIYANDQPDRVGKNFKDAEAAIFGNNLEDAIGVIKRGESKQYSGYSPVLKSNVQIDLTGFQIGDTGKSWSIMVVATEDFMLLEVNAMRRFAIMLGAILIVVAAAIVFIILTRTVKPIITVANTLKDIAQGEGDLTKSVNVHSKDEVGDLAKYFNETLGKIKALVLTIKKEGVVLTDIGNDLASNMTETAAAVNEITANIQSIKNRVINESASVTQENATMEQLTQHIEKLEKLIEKQSSNVSQASAAIEEMVANTQSVTDTLVKNAANVKTLQESSEVGRTGLQDVASDIQEIARESEGLLEINAVMENIASQTNLLSMNAAIEAAHAGEAGKGFAVVADEIRKLAESSGEQSKTISTVLKKIKGSIDKITKSTENVLNKFEAIDTSVKTVAQQEENIRNAMEEQGQGSKQILSSIGQLNEITGEVKSSSQEMLVGAKEVIHESQNLEKQTQEITSGMNEMATGADQINLAVNQVNEISVKNREGIATLMKEVSRFKVE